MFKDPILNKLVKKYGAPNNFKDRSKFLYEELVESIIGQQLSGKAADTIFKRFLALYKGSKFPKPEELLKTNVEKLRGAGMSYSKASYIKNIAQAFKDKKLDAKKLKKMSDEEVKTELVKIKGVGNWTAEMILIFTLKREDVFSLGDAGLRRAIKNLYNIEKEKDILKLSEKWKPKRSYACWYLWRSLENR
ncbi:MAG TPA: DNA-3-methyladenine glycosylase [Candidatus Sulfotelmatobacter sp.]|nr:DNA-3-methyladenine glycosylase [Candidatus Sulfotelmatobacter sp.]